MGITSQLWAWAMGTGGHWVLRVREGMQVPDPCACLPASPVSPALSTCRYFGFITKHPADHRFACHVFVSEESTKPLAESVG